MYTLLKKTPHLSRVCEYCVKINELVEDVVVVCDYCVKSIRILCQKCATTGLPMNEVEEDAVVVCELCQTCATTADE